jgi:hypothetical protein
VFKYRNQFTLPGAFIRDKMAFQWGEAILVATESGTTPLFLLQTPGFEFIQALAYPSGKSSWRN